MRIHTSLSRAEVLACRPETAYFSKLEERGSRSRERAFDVILTGSSNRKQNTGDPYSADRAATWDEWGVFFGRLFNADPDATCYAYDGHDDFNWKTGDRFAKGEMPEDTHAQHRFEYVGQLAGGGQLSRCKSCPATRKHR